MWIGPRHRDDYSVNQDLVGGTVQPVVRLTGFLRQPDLRCTPPTETYRVPVMTVRLFVAVLLFWPTIAAGQVTGRFYLEKETFAPGEPVFVYFEARNIGMETQNILQADPYSFSSGYALRVSSDPAPNSSCASMWMGGSCLSSD